MVIINNQKFIKLIPTLKIKNLSVTGIHEEKLPVQKILKAESVSVGDFVLTGGEIPAMIIIDSISRQVKGVLGDFNSLEELRKNVLGNEDAGSEEFYTRPEILEIEIKGKVKKYKVPPVFLSGNPKLISEYKNKNRNIK